MYKRYDVEVIREKMDCEGVQFEEIPNILRSLALNWISHAVDCEMTICPRLLSQFIDTTDQLKEGNHTIIETLAECILPRDQLRDLADETFVRPRECQGLVVFAQWKPPRAPPKKTHAGALNIIPSKTGAEPERLVWVEPHTRMNSTLNRLPQFVISVAETLRASGVKQHKEVYVIRGEQGKGKWKINCFKAACRVISRLYSGNLSKDIECEVFCAFTGKKVREDEMSYKYLNGQSYEM